MAEKAQRKVRKARPAAAPADPRTAAVYALMAQAESLYRRRHYRKAIAACNKIAALDPTNAMPEQMLEGCRRELRTRRAVVASVAAALALAALGIFAVYSGLTRLRIRPEPGTVRLQEGQAQAFTFQSHVGYHKTLEYRWSLLDGAGRPVPALEEGTLRQHAHAAWECTYKPLHSLVRGSEGGRPVVRRLVASGLDTAGREALRAEWEVVVSHVPMSPRAYSVSPRAEETASVVAGTGSRAFTVVAEDGDGGKDLAFEWFVGGVPAHRSGEPTWVYRPPADALPRGRSGRESAGNTPLALTCRISNAHGEPRATEVAWRVQPVRSNAPPQIVRIEPGLSHINRIKEGEALTITANVFDPDEGEAIRYTWELADGADVRTVSRWASCTLGFPNSTTDKEKLLTLRLRVSDPCGAEDERSWQLLVVDAPPPLLPP